MTDSAELEREVDRLSAAVAELQSWRDELSRQDRSRSSAGADLLAALAAEALIGDEFTCREIVDHARLPACFLLGETLRAIGIGSNTRRLGRLLAGIEGWVIDGRVVRRIGEEAAGIVWRLETHNPSG